MPGASVQVDDRTWLVEAGGDDLTRMAWYLTGPGLDVEVLGPAGLRQALAQLGHQAVHNARDPSPGS